jgi:hypothetical protein
MGPISITDHRLRLHPSIQTAQAQATQGPTSTITSTFTSPIASLIAIPNLHPASRLWSSTNDSISHLCGVWSMHLLLIQHTLSFKVCLCLVMNCKAVGQAAGWGLRAPTEDHAPLSCLQYECALVSSLCFFMVLTYPFCHS